MKLAHLGFVPVLGLFPLLGFGCSDPAPLTPQGAWSLQFIDPGPTCPVAGETQQMGAVSVHGKDQLLSDGEPGITVDCKVSGSGGSFTVSATGEDKNKAVYLDIYINGITKDTRKEAPATGNITYSSPKTSGDAAMSSEPCTFWFEPGSEQGVSPGSIWVAFECPTVSIDGQDGCEIRQGVAFFGSCES